MKDEIIKVIKTIFAITISVLLSGRFSPFKKNLFSKNLLKRHDEKRKVKKKCRRHVVFFFDFSKYVYNENASGAMKIENVMLRRLIYIFRKKKGFFSFIFFLLLPSST